MKTFEYRLYPHKEQSHLLMQCLIESRGMYSAMLETVKAEYEDQGTYPGKYDLENAFKGQGEHVPATTVRMLADRLTKSLNRFLAAKKHSIPGSGFPRFKKPNRWHSIQLRQYGKDIYLHEDKKHRIVPKKLGHFLKIKLHRPIEGTAKTVHLVHRADSHWYALLACEADPHTVHVPCECAHPDIGIDVVEDLQITAMVKNHHLSKSIMDASWGAFLAILSAKAASAGHEVIRVNPRFTSQKCSRCGEIVHKSLSVRTHICPFCGYMADRDVNAAKNILKAGAQPSGVNVRQ
jgi:IS605 OrfB family transposase